MSRLVRVWLLAEVEVDSDLTRREIGDGFARSLPLGSYGIASSKVEVRSWLFKMAEEDGSNVFALPKHLDAGPQRPYDGDEAA